MTNGESEDFLPPDLDALGVEAPEQPLDEDDGVSKALAAHHDDLMARSGVVMIGETIDATGRSAIMIGVRAHKNMSRLPREVDGVPVVVQVIGEVEAQK